MAADNTIAELLRCPETSQKLRPLDQAKLDELNEAIRSGELHNDGGDRVEQTLDGGLVREDDEVVYPVRDGVPNLLLADRISLAENS